MGSEQASRPAMPTSNATAGEMLAGARSVLGEGGMARVLLGFDPVLRRNVALKVQKKRSATTDLRFVYEAQILAQLQHPGLVPVYSLSRNDDGSWVYAMRPIRGQTLAEILTKLRNRDSATLAVFSLRRLMDVFLRVCETINYAHRCGVIHRDLKPANIMVDRFGSVLVLDWGLAKITSRPMGMEVGASAEHLPVSVADPGGGAVAEAGGSLLAPVPGGGAGGLARTGASAGRSRLHAGEDGVDGSNTASQAEAYAADAADAAGLSHSGASLRSSSDLPPLVTIGQQPGTDWDASLTAEGHTVGSPAYMSPEQMRHSVLLDHRTDLYALGATLYELLTLRRPHQARNLQALMQAKMRGVPHPSDVAPNRHIPELLASLAMRLLASDPAQRVGSAAEVIDVLRLYLDGSIQWKLLRDDSFRDRRIPAGWKSRSGVWQASAGVLRQVDPDADAELLLTPPIAGNVRIELEARVPAGQVGSIGLMLGYALRRPHAYVLRFGSPTQAASSIARGHATVAHAAGQTPAPGTWYRVAAERQDSLVRLLVNGQVVLEFVDEDALRKGHVGLCCYGATLDVRRIRVWSSTVAPMVSCLAIPDALRECGQVEEACGQYERIARELEAEQEGGLAEFRAGLCELELGREAAARERFLRLSSGRWSHFGHRGIAACHAAAGDWQAELQVLITACGQNATESAAHVLAELEQRSWHYHETEGLQPAAYLAHRALVELRLARSEPLEAPLALRAIDVAIGQRDWDLVHRLVSHVLSANHLPDICLAALHANALANWHCADHAGLHRSIEAAAAFAPATPIGWQVFRLSWLRALGRLEHLAELATRILPDIRRKVHHAEQLHERCRELLAAAVVLADEDAARSLLQQLAEHFGRSRRLAALCQAAMSMWEYQRSNNDAAQAHADAVRQADLEEAFDALLPMPLLLAASSDGHPEALAWAQRLAARADRPNDPQPVLGRWILAGLPTPTDAGELLAPLDWRRAQRVACAAGELLFILDEPDASAGWFHRALAMQPADRSLPAIWSAARLSVITGQWHPLQLPASVPTVLLQG